MIGPITTLLFFPNFLPSPLASPSTTLAAAITTLTLASLGMIFASGARRLEKSPSTRLGDTLSLSLTAVSVSSFSFHFADAIIA